MGIKSEAEILNSLRKFGFCILENYWSPEKCSQAIKEVRAVPPTLFESGQGGDHRCQHSNRYCKTADEFLKDSFIQGIADVYSDCNSADRTLAGILIYEEGKNKDSGGGWHMDSLEPHQFKSILYLNDVSSQTGPFAFVQKSKDATATLPTYSNLRILEETIANTFEPEDVVEITGAAGTCILVDTTFPHRGIPIKKSARYTYTVYFYNRD